MLREQSPIPVETVDQHLLSIYAEPSLFEERRRKALETLVGNSAAYARDRTVLPELPPELFEADFRDLVMYWDPESLKNLFVCSPTPPDGHYKEIIFLWDVLYAGQVFAALARNRREIGFAIGSLEAVLAGMDESEKNKGAIYNMFFLDKDPGNAAIRLERKTFVTKEDPEARTSKYLQPPLQAETALTIYDAIVRELADKEGANIFLSKVYERLKLSYGYLFNHRRLANGLYYLIHPHATGRDSSPEYAEASGLKGARIAWEEFVEKLLARNPGAHKLIDVSGLEKLYYVVFAGADYAGAIGLNLKQQKLNWEPEACRQNCQIEDIMYNCLLQKNFAAMRTIAEILGKDGDMELFKGAADDLNDAIEREFWSREEVSYYSEEKGCFITEEREMYFSRFNDKHTGVVSISNLFPLILDIPAERVETLLSLLEDRDWFKAPYPIPSVPRGSQYYDPEFKAVERIWLGPTWINTNFEIVKGLVKQIEKFREERPELAERCRRHATDICWRSAEMVQKSYNEFYNPENGKPHRNKVENFSWSTLGDIMGRMAVALERGYNIEEFAHIRLF